MSVEGQGEEPQGKVEVMVIKGKIEEKGKLRE